MQVFVILFDNENGLPIDPDIYASYANALWNEANRARAPPTPVPPLHPFLFCAAFTPSGPVCRLIRLAQVTGEQRPLPEIIKPLD